jgi:hypothetical protein
MQTAGFLFLMVTCVGLIESALGVDIHTPLHEQLDHIRHPCTAPNNGYYRGSGPAELAKTTTDRAFKDLHITDAITYDQFLLWSTSERM